jgi:hypothetical protein
VRIDIQVKGTIDTTRHLGTGLQSGQPRAEVVDVGVPPAARSLVTGAHRQRRL